MPAPRIFTSVLDVSFPSSVFRHPSSDFFLHPFSKARSSKSVNKSNMACLMSVLSPCSLVVSGVVVNHDSGGISGDLSVSLA